MSNEENWRIHEVKALLGQIEEFIKNTIENHLCVENISKNEDYLKTIINASIGFLNHAKLIIESREQDISNEYLPNETKEQAKLSKTMLEESPIIPALKIYMADAEDETPPTYSSLVKSFLNDIERRGKDISIEMGYNHIVINLKMLKGYKILFREVIGVYIVKNSQKEEEKEEISAITKNLAESSALENIDTYISNCEVLLESLKGSQNVTAN